MGIKVKVEIVGIMPSLWSISGMAPEMLHVW